MDSVNQIPAAVPTPAAPMMTLDVEDWEHANFSQLEDRDVQLEFSVRSRAYAMDANTDRWIELLSRNRATSTCFVLGEFARRYPDAVRRLASAGHEIATHGDTHDLVYRMSRDSFREFLKRGIGTVGELTGRAPIGFRAPSWSVDQRTPWLCEELEAQSLKYDSSIFPIQTPLFGQAGSRLEPHYVGGILRVPVTVLTLGGLRLPFASGAFFRLAPLWMIRLGFSRAARRGLPVMTVLHPRELDPAHPRLPLKGWEGWVHYARLRTTVPKLEAILNNVSWKSICESFGRESFGRECFGAGAESSVSLSAKT